MPAFVPINSTLDFGAHAVGEINSTTYFNFGGNFAESFPNTVPPSYDYYAFGDGTWNIPTASTHADANAQIHENQLSQSPVLQGGALTVSTDATVATAWSYPFLNLPFATAKAHSDWTYEFASDGRFEFNFQAAYAPNFNFSSFDPTVSIVNMATGASQSWSVSSQQAIDELLPAGTYTMSISQGLSIYSFGTFSAFWASQGTYQWQLKALPDLAATSLAWNTTNGGVDFSYAVSGTDLPQSSTAALYWSPTSTFDPQTATLAYETPLQPALGNYSVHVGPSDFISAPPANTTNLILVLDPAQTITESDGPNDMNNTLALSGQPVAWGQALSMDFINKVEAIARDLKTDANYLMAAMAFETGETFSPSIQNPQSSAIGLIQFLPQTAKNLGTSIGALSAMPAVEQLDYVELYLAPYAGRLNSLQDVYMAILYPAAIGASSDYVLFDANSADPHIRKAYRQNSGLDSNGDGLITVAEATQLVSRELDKGLGTLYVGYYFGT
ncbi:MAG TPA: hypothetical protein VKS79_21520 [Gemmataceae bacterium]|nr:hypothetical protein [Gemmataceae bacterium]